MSKKGYTTKLSTIADVIQGQSPESNFYSECDGVPFLQGNRTFGNLYPFFDTYTHKVTKMAKKGDVLMSVRAPVGALNYAPCDLCIGRGLASIKAKDGNNQFVYYALKYNVNNLIKQGSATTFDSVNKDIINDFELIIPENKIERNIIAKVLSDLDAKIELNNKINRELEAMAKTLYDYWFVQFDFPNDFAQGKPNEQGKPYKSSGGKMVYNTELKREIPVGWEVKTLLDIANYINGFACQNYRPTNEDYLPVIKIREMRDGITESTEKVKADIPDKLIVNDGDVLFSWSASLEVMIWSGGKGGLNQHIFKVTSKKYPRSFYYYQLIWYLQHFKMIAELRKTTMGHITQDHLKQSRIVIPPIEIVKALDEKLYPIQEKQILLHKQNQQLSELRDWLLPMLMNGQVTVGDSK